MSPSIELIIWVLIVEAICKVVFWGGRGGEEGGEAGGGLFNLLKIILIELLDNRLYGLSYTLLYKVSIGIPVVLRINNLFPSFSSSGSVLSFRMSLLKSGIYLSFIYCCR